MNSTENTYVSPFDWNLLTYCVTGITLCLSSIAVSLNLSNLCTVWCSSQPRRYGYFHLLILFCIFNSVYFVIKSAYLLLDLLRVIDVVDNETTDSVKFLTVLVPDVLTCLLGTSLLILTSLTSDCLCQASVRSKPIQKCWRFFSGVIALVIGAGVMILVLILKFGFFFESTSLSHAAALLVVTSVYLVIFALVPSFCIVIFGTVNWVMDRNSSRQVKSARRAARSIDHQICLVSIILLLLFLVATILQFSQDLEIYGSPEESDVTRLVVEVIRLVIDTLFALYPMLITCAIGKFCLCCDKEEF